MTVAEFFVFVLLTNVIHKIKHKKLLCPVTYGHLHTLQIKLNRSYRMTLKVEQTYPVCLFIVAKTLRITIECTVLLTIRYDFINTERGDDSRSSTMLSIVK